MAWIRFRVFPFKSLAAPPGQRPPLGHRAPICAGRGISISVIPVTLTRTVDDLAAGLNPSSGLPRLTSRPIRGGSPLECSRSCRAYSRKFPRLAATNKHYAMWFEIVRRLPAALSAI